MRKLYFSLLLFSAAWAQAQQVSWQKNIKSNTQDFLSHLSTTLDGQYLLSGSSIQNTEGQQNNGYDFHVLKMNQQGQLLWDKYFGGDKHDFLTATTATEEGGFLLAGTSFSGNKFQKKAKARGGSDIWLIKIDENGEEQWQKTIGGTTDEEAKAVVQSTDFGYFVAGNANNKEGAFGSKDAWVIKLDKTGKLLYQIYLGGDGLDEVEKIIPTKDGGALLGIYSRSTRLENAMFRAIKEKSLETDNDSKNTTLKETDTSLLIPTTFQPITTENFGEGDFWVVKLSKDGKVEWQKDFGGKNDDHIKTLNSSETGFIIAGESRSSGSGNKRSSIQEGTDVWVIALDNKGEEQWQKNFNFNNRDVLMSVNTINDATGIHTKGFLLGGYTQAEDKVEKNDETFWMLYIDSHGEEVWRKYVEGTEKQKEERLVSANLFKDGSYVLAGTTAPELGKENWKVVKLADRQIEQLIEKQDLRIYPNPVQDYCYVEIGIECKDATINLFDMTGKLTLQTKTQNSTTKLDTHSLPQGTYIISVNTESKTLTHKIVKK